MEPEWPRDVDPNKRGARSTLFTGLRPREALGLTWERLDRSRGVVLLEMTKSGRRREVPLNSKAGSDKLRHPGSPILGQAGSPMLSHPGAGMLSHPAEVIGLLGVEAPTGAGCRRDRPG